MEHNAPNLYANNTHTCVWYRRLFDKCISCESLVTLIKLRVSFFYIYIFLSYVMEIQFQFISNTIYLYRVPFFRGSLDRVV